MIPPDRQAGALAQRLAAYLCLVGAVLFALVAAALGRLDRVSGTSAYRLPGGATLDPAAVMVLLICAGVFTLCGVALLVLTPRRATPAGRSRRRRPQLVLVLGAAALLAALVARHLGF